MKRMVMVCDLCGARIMAQRHAELFVGIDGASFLLAMEDGTPIDTCVECHGAMRTEVLHRLACARDRRAMESDWLTPCRAERRTVQHGELTV